MQMCLEQFQNHCYSNQILNSSVAPEDDQRQYDPKNFLSNIVSK